MAVTAEVEIDVLTDKLLPLREVAKLFPSKNGRPVVYETVLGWTRREKGGRRPRLDSIKVGGKRYTSERALREFVSAENHDPIIEKVMAKKRATSRAKSVTRTLEERFKI